MKILKSWLKDHIDLCLSDKELIEKLNISGTEVESFCSTLDEKVVVGEIKEVEKHPNADRLRIAKVFNGKNELTIVCGAPNIEVGQKVPLAKVGAKLGGIEIKETEIRGALSEGMLCSEDELGSGEDHEGIKILPNEYEVGKPLNHYVESDTVFELEITPNRGDCLSHIGIAREIAALTNSSVSKTPIALDMNSANIKEHLSVKINDKKICPSYMARMVQGVKVGPSPSWLKERLVKLGIKPINNIVDITNFIMLDLGQPLHAFDAGKIEGKEIIVRKSNPNEKIKTLDGILRPVKDAILIADKKKAIAVAGVMGGQNSEISENTTSIILESAEFNRKNIRKTVKDLGLVTEASYRFERGIDSGGVEYALNKAAKMIQEAAEGRILSGIAKAGEKTGNQKLKIEYNKIKNMIGLDLAESEINHILKSLGFEIKGNECIVPAWRHDIEIWQDLAEEVARVYGYSKIKQIPLQEAKPAKKSPYYYKEALKDILKDAGFTETINYPYLSEAEVKSANLKVKDLLEIVNPIQPENKYLRNSLAPGLLKSIAKNSSVDPVLLFELGKTFFKKTESSNIAIAASGKGSKEAIGDAVDRIEDKLKINRRYLSVREVPLEDLKKFKIRKPSAHMLEIMVDELLPKMKFKPEDLILKSNKKQVSYKTVSKFPSVTRDLAFIVDREINSIEVEDAIVSTSGLISRVELFDEFASNKFGANKKNIAYHIYLQHPEKTMTDKEADGIIKDIVSKIEEKYKAELRK